MGFFEKLKQGLSKTHTNLFTKVNRLVNSKSSVDDEFISQLEEILLSSDVGIQTTEIIIENLRKRVKEEKYLDSMELNIILKDELQKVFARNSYEEVSPIKNDNKPHVIMIVGVNGVGKTTSVGKLAFNYISTGHSVLIGAADTFRAAANEQLEKWSQKAGAGIIHLEYGSDPGAVVFNTINTAITRNADVVLIDTAGRLHTKINLMEELKKVKRVIQKFLPEAPHEILLVIDATTGQNGLNQAKEFSNAIGITGIILTKLDGTAKGGIVLKICNELKIPVKYIGVGEQIDDLQSFDKVSFVKALIED